MKGMIKKFIVTASSIGLYTEIYIMGYFLNFNHVTS